MRKKEISMIILAGGASSRMGRDKSDLTIDGKTFLEMQIEKGEKLGISDILLSGYHGENKYKYPIIPDRFPGKGPLGGLEACFRKAKNPYCLVLGVDVPLVPAEELAALIRQSLHSDAKAVILSTAGMRNLLWEYTVQTWQMPCLKKSQSGKAQSLLFCGKMDTNATKARLRPGIFPISMIRKHIKK